MARTSAGEGAIRFASTLRFLSLVAVAVTSLAAACPIAEDGVDEVPPRAERARVTVGETVGFQDGRLRVTLVGLERGGTFAEVTLRLETETASTTGEVTAVRARDYSDPVRLEDWIVRTEGLPGVDAAYVVAWRE